MILTLSRALWLISALVPGFVAAVLHEMARLRLLFCSVSDGAAIPADLNQFRHLVPGMSMADHLTGAAIFLPVMVLALITTGRKQWLAMALGIVWIGGVLFHLGLQIPAACPPTAEGTSQEPLLFYIWPALLLAMVVSRLNSTDEIRRKRARTARQ